MTEPSEVEFAPDLPRPAVCCTVVKIVGSCPQQAGARMWVTADAFRGTVGGGRFEYEVLIHARGLLAASRAEPELKEYVLCRELGQCCGGRVLVFFEPAGRRRTAHLFGAGHVGRAAAQVLLGMPFAVSVIDPRRSWCQGLPPETAAHCVDPLEYARGRSWSRDDAVCIFTHSHELDFRLAEFFLGRELGYLGLIGSQHKAEVFQARLKAGNPGAEELWGERMRCPIGLPLPGKNPKVIAVSIAAQLLAEWALAREPRGAAGLP